MLVFMKFLLVHCLSKIKAFSFIFILCKEKNIKIVYADFFAMR